MRDARDADAVGTHRDNSHAPARLIAGDRNQQAIATKHARHRHRRRQPNRARDQVAGCGSYRDVQATATEIRDQLVGSVVTDRMTDLIEKRGPRSDRERIETRRLQWGAIERGHPAGNGVHMPYAARRLEGIEPI